MSNEIKYSRYGRTVKARLVRIEALRDKMRAGAYIHLLERIAGMCHNLTPEQVPAYALKVRTYFGLLAKVLPDLKAIEHSGSIGRQPVNEMSLDALRAELAEVRGQLRGADTPARVSSEPGKLN